MEFGLLGPLLVRSGQGPVQVSAGKQRVLLAALLLAANEVVATTQLAAAMWQARPPETARVTLQNYMMRLRHALGPAGYERIVSHPSGYLIKVDPGELDVARFTEWQAAGLSAARGREWEEASAWLSAALGLWRGEPLADVPSPLLVAAEVPRLNEMRLEAVETRIGAHLHLGRHHEVTGELQALAAAEPLRERVHELLMLALYRCGQQAAALAAYRHARRQLIDEVGIEPGPALRDLNQRILRGDPTLRLPAPRTGDGGSRNRSGRSGHDLPGSTPGGQAGPAGRQPGGTPPPAMLPAEPHRFTGRAAELRALSAMLPPRRKAPPAARGAAAAMPGPADRVLIAAIGGTAGVGKTALAVHFARQHAAQFPDGQLYVNLRGFGPAGDLVPPADALRSLLEALEVPAAQVPATLDGRQARYRSLLAGRRMVVVLDNARDPDQVRPLLPGSPGCMVIVTSRNQLTGLVAAEGAQPLTLDVLSSAEARELLIRRLGPDRVAAEPAATSELTRLSARLPLALAVVAARAATRPGRALAALAAELRGIHGRLDALTTGEAATDVRAVFSWSCHQLDPPAARMFRLLGLHPGPDISAPAAASLAGVPPAEARRLVRELTRANLLAEHSPGRYGLHDLLRAYAREQAEDRDGEAARRAAVGRVLDHYLHTAHTAALLLNPSREPVSLAQVRPGVTPEQLTSHQQARAWLDAEHHVLAAAAAAAADAGLDACAWQLPWAMATFLDGRAQWHEQLGLLRTALAAATRLGDRAGQAISHRLAASACARLGDYPQARGHLADCLRLHQQAGDRAGEARVHQSLGWVAERQGRYTDAVAHNEQALALYQAVGHRAGQADALNSAGFCYALAGDYHRAREYSRQALQLLREVGNRLHLADAWDSVGYAEHHLGRLAEAAGCYQQALDLYREFGHRYPETQTLIRLGENRQAAGDQAAARDAWLQAMAILDELHHPEADQVRARLASAPGISRRPAVSGPAVRGPAGARR